MGQGVSCPLIPYSLSFLTPNIMAKKKAARIIIALACTQCKERNYTTTKNRTNDPGRLELSKYCPRCKRHTLHRETK